MVLFHFSLEILKSFTKRFTGITGILDAWGMTDYILRDCPWCFDTPYPDLDADVPLDRVSQVPQHGTSGRLIWWSWFSDAAGNGCVLLSLPPSSTQVLSWAETSTIYDYVPSPGDRYLSHPLRTKYRHPLRSKQYGALTWNTKSNALNIGKCLAPSPLPLSTIHSLSSHHSPTQWTFNHFTEIGTAWNKGRTILTPCPVTLSQSLLWVCCLRCLPREAENANSYLLRQSGIWSGKKWDLPTARGMPLDQNWVVIAITLNLESISKFEILTGLRYKTCWSAQHSPGWRHTGQVKEQDITHIRNILTLDVWPIPDIQREVVQPIWDSKTSLFSYLGNKYLHTLGMPKPPPSKSRTLSSRLWTENTSMVQ